MLHHVVYLVVCDQLCSDKRPQTRNSSFAYSSSGPAGRPHTVGHDHVAHDRHSKLAEPVNTTCHTHSTRTRDRPKVIFKLQPKPKGGRKYANGFQPKLK